MKVHEAVATRIQELCEKQKMTVNGLANISGLSPSTVKSIIYGASKNPGVATVKILCDGLGITLVDFFDASVFDELEQEIE
jgi:transcriptional regulator with XRE-family HTH domain